MRRPFVRYAVRIAAAEPPQREPIHFVSNAMSSKLGQLFQFRCPSHRDGSRRRNISQVANSLHTVIWNESRRCTNTFSVSNHFAQTTGSTLTKKKKKKRIIRACYTLHVYVYMLMFHVHLSRHLFCSLRCSITRVHFVYVYMKKYCYCHCYYQLSPDVVTSVAIKQRSLGIR